MNTPITPRTLEQLFLNVNELSDIRTDLLLTPGLFATVQGLIELDNDGGFSAERVNAYVASQTGARVAHRDVNFAFQQTVCDLTEALRPALREYESQLVRFHDRADEFCDTIYVPLSAETIRSMRVTEGREQPNYIQFNAWNRHRDLVAQARLCTAKKDTPEPEVGKLLWRMEIDGRFWDRWKVERNMPNARENAGVLTRLRRSMSCVDYAVGWRYIAGAVDDPHQHYQDRTCSTARYVSRLLLGNSPAVMRASLEAAEKLPAALAEIYAK